MATLCGKREGVVGRRLFAAENEKIVGRRAVCCAQSLGLVCGEVVWRELLDLSFFVKKVERDLNIG